MDEFENLNNEGDNEQDKAAASGGKYANIGTANTSKQQQKGNTAKNFMHKYVVQNDRPVLYIPYTLICLIVFIVAGAVSQRWDVAWVAFLGIPILNWLTMLVLHITERKLPKEKRTEMQSMPIIWMSLIAFLLLGFLGDWWHPAWVIFLCIPVYYCLWFTFSQYRSRKRKIERERELDNKSDE